MSKVIKPVFYIVFIVFLMVGFPSWSQDVPESENLVPNGNFEEYDECPEYLNGNGVEFLGAKGWLIPTLGSPDYYNSCSSQEVGVPNNILGDQYAKEGNAYAGLLLYDALPNAREYIVTQLNSDLKPNTKYFWCFWVSLADNVDYASNNIGIALTKNYFYKNTENVLDLVVYGNQNKIIKENSDWELVSGSFISKGNENFLYIGNFFNDLNTQIEQIKYNTIAGPAAYYYIDNVYLGEFPCVHQEISIPNIFTPNDDGMNDLYKINSKGIEDGKIEIFNRWGNCVFTGGIFDSWDGRYNGKECVSGVYFIRIQFYDSFLKKQEIKTGFIHLMR